MKAIIIEQAGGVENLLMSDQPKPAISVNEVMVETRALGINPADTKVRYDNEALTQLFGEDRPMILGWDIAGTVVETGCSCRVYQFGEESRFCSFPRRR